MLSQCSENESDNAGWSILEEDKILNFQFFERKEVLISWGTVLLKDGGKHSDSDFHPKFLLFSLIVDSVKSLPGYFCSV